MLASVGKTSLFPWTGTRHRHLNSAVQWISFVWPSIDRQTGHDFEGDDSIVTVTLAFQLIASLPIGDIEEADAKELRLRTTQTNTM